MQYFTYNIVIKTIIAILNMLCFRQIVMESTLQSCIIICKKLYPVRMLNLHKGGCEVSADFRNEKVPRDV